MSPLAFLNGFLICLGLATIVAAIGGIAWCYCLASGSTGTPRERRAFDADLDAQRTPGLGVLDGGDIEPDPESPLFDATSLHLLDQGLPTVYDVDEWPGHGGAA